MFGRRRSEFQCSLKKGPASRCIERIQMFAVERQPKNSSVFRNRPRIPMLEIIISEYPSLKG